MKSRCFALALAALCSPALGTSPATAEPPAGTAPAPAGEVKIADGQLVLPGSIVFETGSANLGAESEPALRALRDYLAKRTDITLVRIEGHVAGSGEAALMLSGERAFSVGRWLRDQGIECNRLLAAAFGDSKPVADRSTPEGAARNTRITLVPAQLRGKSIGGLPVDGGAPLSTNLCPE